MFKPFNECDSCASVCEFRKFLRNSNFNENILWIEQIINTCATDEFVYYVVQVTHTLSYVQQNWCLYKCRQKSDLTMGDILLMMYCIRKLSSNQQQHEHIQEFSLNKLRNDQRCELWVFAAIIRKQKKYFLFYDILTSIQNCLNSFSKNEQTFLE